MFAIFDQIFGIFDQMFGIFDQILAGFLALDQRGGKTEKIQF